MCKTAPTTRTFRWHLPAPACFLAACLTLIAGAAFAAPVINTITPTTGGPGVSVQISGTGLATVTAVQFNGTKAGDFTVNSDTEITVNTPTGATTGRITATSPSGTGTSPVRYTVVPAPANDNFLNAQVLAGGVPQAAAGTNAGATKETGEPDIIAGDTGGRSIWYSFIPPESGVYTVTTRGSDFDTVLGVFSGNTLTTLSEVASNDDDPSGLSTSAVTFNATRNVTYHIAVDGFAGAAGNVLLNILGSTTGFTLYRTGFDNGEGFDASVPLINQKGWASVGNITGGNGVTFNQIPNLDQAGFVGGGTPLSNGAASVQVFHPVNYEPSEADDESIVYFTTLVKFTASTNGQADRFGFTASGATDNTAAAEATGRYFTILFNEATHTVSYQLNDGSAPVATGVRYKDGVVYVLQEQIDFNTDLWSATLNGVAIATDLPLANADGDAPSLTRVSADWTPANAANPGDNLMAFDEYSVDAPEQFDEFNPSAAAIFLQPSSQTVTAGKPAFFAVLTLSQVPLSYQWNFNGQPIDGATGPTYTIPVTNPADAGEYTVTVTDIGVTVGLPPQPVEITSSNASLVISTALAAVSTVVENTPDVAQVKVTSGQAASVLLTRTGDLSNGLTVNYRVGGTARSGVDYQALSGKATFKAGHATKRIKVVTIDQGIRDGSTVKVSITLLSGNGYTTGKTPKQKVFITRD